MADALIDFFFDVDVACIIWYDPGQGLTRLASPTASSMTSLPAVWTTKTLTATPGETPSATRVVGRGINVAVLFFANQPRSRHVISVQTRHAFDRIHFLRRTFTKTDARFLPRLRVTCGHRLSAHCAIFAVNSTPLGGCCTPLGVVSVYTAAYHHGGFCVKNERSGKFLPGGLWKETLGDHKKCVALLSNLVLKVWLKKLVLYVCFCVLNT